MKPFNLELAKAGHPVCTRDGRDARILYFDKKNTKFKIIALIDDGDVEAIYCYCLDGKFYDEPSAIDLMMKSVKKEGWINIYKPLSTKLPYGGGTIYSTKEEAYENRSNFYLTTIKIEWEE